MLLVRCLLWSAFLIYHALCAPPLIDNKFHSHPAFVITLQQITNWSWLASASILPTPMPSRCCFFVCSIWWRRQKRKSNPARFCTMGVISSTSINQCVFNGFVLLIIFFCVLHAIGILKLKERAQGIKDLYGIVFRGKYIPWILSLEKKESLWESAVWDMRNNFERETNWHFVTWFS